MAKVHERLTSLIEFTQQTAALKAAPTCDIASHRDFRRYESAINRLPAIKLNKVSELDEVWLRVERLHETAPPALDDKLLELWVTVSNNPVEAPYIKKSVDTEILVQSGYIKKPSSSEAQLNEITAFEDFFDAEIIKINFENYVKAKWEAWATEEKQRRKTMELYAELFTLKQKLEGGITDSFLEFVWGVGIAVWDMNGEKVSYPIITRQVEISINKGSSAIEVRPCDKDAQLELEIYTATDNLGAPQLDKAYKEFCATSNQTFSPFDAGTYESVIRFAATCLDSKGIYWPSQTTPDDRTLPSSGAELKVTDTWVIFARRKSKSLLVQDLQRFKDLLEENSEYQIPNAILSVLTEPSTESIDMDLPEYRGMSMTSSQYGGGNGSEKKPDDLFFPMAFNDDQVRIVQLLEKHDGVVVQGPPGTGKTHTIANIICHYFASGKRILVTSMKEPALAVLRDKLPEDIRPLAISLLSNEREGIKQFEQAISKIAGEVQNIHAPSYRAEISSLIERVDKLHAQLARTDRELSSWARKNLNEVLLDQEPIAPIDAAKEVLESEGSYEWLDDELQLDNKPLFDDQDIVALRRVRAETASDFEYLQASLPNFPDLPDLSSVQTTHQALLERNEIEKKINEGSLPELSGGDDVVSNLSLLNDAANELHTLTEKCEALAPEWSEQARAWILQSSQASGVQDIFDILGEEILAALEQRKQYIAKPILIADDIDMDEELCAAIANKVAGKHAFGLGGIIGKKEAKNKINAIKILGNAPTTNEDWQYVSSYINLQKTYRQLLLRWNSVSIELSVSTIEIVPSNAITVGQWYSYHRLLRKHIEAENKFNALIEKIFPQWDVRHNSALFDKIKKVRDAVARHSSLIKLTSALKDKASLHSFLAEYTGQVSEKLKEFWDNRIGNDAVSMEQVRDTWVALTGEVKRLNALRGAFNVVKDVASKIHKSGAVNWSNKLSTQAANKVTDSLLPDNWQKAWRLKRLSSYLATCDGRKFIKDLSRQRKLIEEDLAKSYSDIVSKKTWLSLRERCKPDVQAALTAYQAAIARIGAGTGTRAVRYRQDARRAAERANHAIPCWIMPHFRVSETLPAFLGAFDLVIIDEASQSDLTALPALLRAKKILIVGDDKQVSPEGVGLEEEKIRQLMGRYLANQVDDYRAQMSPERSMYDLFKVVFAHSSLMLKEHFRCAEPIIEYSKREYYNHELKPVRMPRASERINPPLVDVVVEDGFRKGDVNIPEARFIVDEIIKICAMEEMKNRTIGVVSLLADKQALKVWEMLEKELGPEKIEHHQIACGDARTFQGKERDIIFLSMVVSQGDAFAQTKDTIGQRYNVAASRARDRMYLVRSIEVEQLSPKDKLRRNLITHFSTPFMQEEKKVSSLRELCESDFEREVYDLLTQKGYRVIPQVRVGEYRIDMVVEGDNDARLAIECDGDKYHGVDKWESDMFRQRVLERAGWHFWRCFASDFIRNKQSNVDDLFEQLKARGIEPIGSENAPRTLHTEHRRVEAYPKAVAQEPIEEEVEPLRYATAN